MKTKHPILAHFHQSVSDLILPALSMAKVLFIERKQEQHTLLHGLENEQAMHVRQAQNALARLCLRHQPMRQTRHTDYRQALNAYSAERERLFWCIVNT